MSIKRTVMFETESLRAIWSEYDSPIGDKLGEIDFERKMRDLMGAEYWSYLGSEEVNKYRGNANSAEVGHAAATMLFYLYEKANEHIDQS